MGGQEDLSPRIDMELGKGRRKEGTAAAKGVAALCRGNDHPQGSPISRDTAQHRHILNHGPAGWIFLRDLGWGGVGWGDGAFPKGGSSQRTGGTLVRRTNTGKGLTARNACQEFRVALRKPQAMQGLGCQVEDQALSVDHGEPQEVSKYWAQVPHYRTPQLVRSLAPGPPFYRWGN